MTVVDKSDIQLYAKRNTSPKIPLEAKMVEAYVDSIFNSDKMSNKYETLSDQTRNGEMFVITNSLDRNAKDVIDERYKAVIAYSMIKKDKHLFDLICSLLFTGEVIEHQGLNVENPIKCTDECESDGTPKCTDNKYFTDFKSGFVTEVFYLNYCNSPVEKSPYNTQLPSTILEKMNTFDELVCIVKPARLNIAILYVPCCYVTEDKVSGVTNSTLQNPLSDYDSVNVIKTMSIEERKKLFSHVTVDNYICESKREVNPETTDSIVISFELRCDTNSLGDNPWEKITIHSNKDGVKDLIFSPDYLFEQTTITIHCLNLTIEIPNIL